MTLHLLWWTVGCALSHPTPNERLEKISHRWEMQEKQGEKQTCELNARSSPGKVQDCLPEVYLHHGISFFSCCLESDIKCFILN